MRANEIKENYFFFQNWNAYSYVKGNPVNYNDPSGHFQKLV
jgi:RHS repeat-associated protein